MSSIGGFRAGDKTNVSTQLAACRQSLDQWVLKALRQIYRLLLPVCQSRFTDTLSPWRLKTKSLSFANLEKTVTALITLDQQLLWVDPIAVQQAYEEFNQLCAQKQSDLLSQLHQLIRESKSTSADHNQLHNWQRIWKKLLQQWRQCGYHAQVVLWKDLLQKEFKTQESVLEIIEPENAALTLLQSGLENLASTKSSTKIPDTWEKAHAAWQRMLINYAAHGQKAAFYQAKNQYQARLESYRSFLTIYTETHSGYQSWTQWCDQQLEAIKTLTPHLASQLVSPATWLWQSVRAQLQSETPTEKTQISILKNCLSFLQTFLGEPPCDYEIMAMKSMTGPEQWRLHLLVGQSEHITHPYFLAFTQIFTLYHALLPSEALPIKKSHIQKWGIQCYTPQQLAVVYCPSLPEDENLESTDHHTFLPALYFFASSKKTQPGKLYESFSIYLYRRLQEVVQQAEIQENRIRKQHHALTTQPLIKTQGPFSDAQYALEQRQQAHRSIRHLKHYVQDHYAPLIDLMVYFLLEKPEFITACLQSIRVQLTQSDEKKESPVKSSLYLLFYRHIPRIWKPRFIQRFRKALGKTFSRATTPFTAITSRSGRERLALSDIARN